MTLQPLPERANLEQLKKKAKSLLAAARGQEPNAIQRFEAVLIGRSLKPDAIALHDAQFVLAREYGFKSWTELKQEVEERSLSFAAAVDEFVRCATGSAPERAMRLLARHAGIANANLYTELVLGDADAVETRLKANPAIAGQRGGVQNWEPLLYVCHTFLQKDSPERAKGLVRIARELLRIGANPNAEFDWNWHSQYPYGRFAQSVQIVKSRSIPLPVYSVLRFSAGMLHGADGHPRTATHPTLSQPAGASDGADENQNQNQNQHPTDGSDPSP
jgi:hypothetical protein